MELIRKNIQFKSQEDASRSRSFWITGSTEDVDRDNDRIMADGWHLENFKKNPVVPWAHKYDQPPVAKALETKVENKKLRLLIKFATAEEYPFADTIYRLYKAKFLNAFSVGFHPIGQERVERLVNGRKITGYDYIEQELWEVSACTVPSNPNALAAAKQKGVITAREFGDVQKVQTSLENDSALQVDFNLAEIAISCGDRIKARIGKIALAKARSILEARKRRGQ